MQRTEMKALTIAGIAATAAIAGLTIPLQTAKADGCAIGQNCDYYAGGEFFEGSCGIFVTTCICIHDNHAQGQLACGS